MFLVNLISGPFPENLNPLIVSFHFMHNIDLHKLIPIAPSGHLLLQRPINQNIQNTKSPPHRCPLIPPHLLNRILKRMLIIQHLM